MSSPMMKVAVRMWSATMRKARVVFVSSRIVGLAAQLADLGQNVGEQRRSHRRSSCRSARRWCAPDPCRYRRSSARAASKLPSACLLYCMNTSFQISRYRPQSQAGEQSGPQGSLSVMMNISVSGPQGPVMPAGPHQLFSLGRIEDVVFRHAAAAPQVARFRRRAGQSSSPANTEKARRSLGQCPDISGWSGIPSSRGWLPS